MSVFNFKITGLDYTLPYPSLTTISYPVESMGGRLGIHLTCSRSSDESVLVITDRPEKSIKRDIESYLEVSSFESPSEILIEEIHDEVDLLGILNETEADIVLIEFYSQYTINPKVERQLSEFVITEDTYVFVSSPFISETMLSIADVNMKFELKSRSDTIITNLTIPKNRFGSPITDKQQFEFDPTLKLDNTDSI